jgi:hypothetical protein
MRRTILILVAGAALLGLTACDNRSNVDTTGTTSSVNKAPAVDADPTPDTGAGGNQQNATPDGTINGAPLGDQNQQHPPKQ